MHTKKLPLHPKGETVVVNSNTHVVDAIENFRNQYGLETNPFVKKLTEELDDLYIECTEDYCPSEEYNEDLQVIQKEKSLVHEFEGFFRMGSLHFEHLLSTANYKDLLQLQNEMKSLHITTCIEKYYCYNEQLKERYRDLLKNYKAKAEKFALICKAPIIAPLLNNESSAIYKKKKKMEEVFAYWNKLHEQPEYLLKKAIEEKLTSTRQKNTIDEDIVSSAKERVYGFYENKISSMKQQIEQNTAYFGRLTRNEQESIESQLYFMREDIMSMIRIGVTEKQYTIREQRLHAFVKNKIDTLLTSLQNDETGEEPVSERKKTSFFSKIRDTIKKPKSLLQNMTKRFLKR